MAKWTKETMEKFIKDKGYTVHNIGEGDSRAVITVSCGKKDHDSFAMRFADFARKDRPYMCPQCKGHKLNTGIIADMLLDQEWVLIKHNHNEDRGIIALCSGGHTVVTSVHNIKNGKQCERCLQSRTAYIVDRTLCYLYGYDNVSVNHIVNYRDHRLRYDFYVGCEKNFYVEYDGEHHQKNKFKKSDKEFEAYISRDKLKDEFAELEGTPFLRLPFPIYGAEAIIKILDFTGKRIPLGVFEEIVRIGLDRITPQAKDKSYDRRKEIADQLLVPGNTIKSVAAAYDINHKRPLMFFKSIYGVGTREYKNGKLWKDYIEE